MLYCFWDMAHSRGNCYFSFWAIFSPFTPLQPKKWKCQKNEKNTLRYHHLTQVYQKSSSIAPEIWQMADVIVIFSFWAIFTIPPSSPKNENLKTFKKHLEISSLYTSIPKIMIICYTVPEIYGARGM